MFNDARYLITIAEMETFSEDADVVFTRSEMEALVQCLSVNPFYGEIIDDSSGVRLLKWPAASQGIGGHARVLYYFHDLNTPVNLIALLERGERLSLSSASKRIMRLLVAEIVSSCGARRELRFNAPTGAA
jgi:hypothetical protein